MCPNIHSYYLPGPVYSSVVIGESLFSPVVPRDSLVFVRWILVYSCVTQKSLTYRRMISPYIPVL